MLTAAKAQAAHLINSGCRCIVVAFRVVAAFNIMTARIDDGGGGKRRDRGIIALLSAALNDNFRRRARGTNACGSRNGEKEIKSVASTSSMKPVTRASLRSVQK